MDHMHHAPAAVIRQLLLPPEKLLLLLLFLPLSQPSHPEEDVLLIHNADFVNFARVRLAVLVNHTVPHAALLSAELTQPALRSAPQLQVIHKEAVRAAETPQLHHPHPLAVHRITS